MPIHKYQRVVTPGPNGATLYFRNTETNDALELAELDGWHYVFVPDGVTLPTQHADIQWQDVTLTDALKEQIKAASRPCQLIAEAMQRSEGNQSIAAKMLGITRQALNQRLKRKEKEAGEE